MSRKAWNGQVCAGAATVAMMVVCMALAGPPVPGQNDMISQVTSQPAQKPGETPTPGSVYVVLWFDTEDYIQPESDDAAKRLAEFLTQHGITATFKVVGEKARTLERRQRQDVIAAIERHEIGYHSNAHSQHPTVAEYESTLDWNAGVEEFARRERAGFDDVARIFKKKPVAYGQPGASWAPQTFPALRMWGVQAYLAAGKQVGLKDPPFWYGRLLNLMTEDQLLPPNPDGPSLDEAKAKLKDLYSALASRKEGGVIGLYFHPCEFVQKEFWDDANFIEGANPPAQDWKLPPQKTHEETEEAFQYFEGLVLFLKSLPRVDFITASDLARRYRDLAQKHDFSTSEIAAIAGRVHPEVSFQVGERFSLSASEVFYLLNKFVANNVAGRGEEPIILDGTPYGPASSPALLAGELAVPRSQFARTARDVQDGLEKTGQIPTAVWLGSEAVPPESYLVGLAQATRTLMEKGGPPETVNFLPATLAAAQYVAADSPELWDWSIFPRGFHAPGLISLAKLQAWTLKPAHN